MTSAAALYDLEQEKAVIGNILLIGLESLEKALSTGLDAPHFYDEKNRIIFRTLLKLAKTETPINDLSLKKTLQESEQLDTVGVIYLAHLADGIPMNIDIAYYAGQIVKLSGERGLLAALGNAQTAALQGNGDLHSALKDIRKALDACESQTETREHRHLAAKVRDYIDGIEGTFYTHQVYADLDIKDPRDKANVRQILNRLKGTEIQSYGSQPGFWRVVKGDLEVMDLANAEGEGLDLRMPLDLHNYVTIMPGNEIIVTGDPDSGKTGFLLRTVRQNLDSWDCHYFNSEMGPLELRKRLDLFQDFPINHPHFHAYERTDCFEDVIQPGKYVLNVIDYLEITDEFYLISKRLQDIYKNLHDSVAIIAIQKRSKTSDLPLGAQRALEKPRLAIALSAGSKTTPNRATILKCKNRKTDHSMIGRSRPFKLIAGCEFRSESPLWD